MPNNQVPYECTPSNKHTAAGTMIGKTDSDLATGGGITNMVQGRVSSMSRYLYDDMLTCPSG